MNGLKLKAFEQPTWFSSCMTGCSGNIFALFLSYILSNASYQNFRRNCAIFSSETLNMSGTKKSKERQKKRERLGHGIDIDTIDGQQHSFCFLLSFAHIPIQLF